MNPLISICVPVYNVAPFIERCVHSLMQQTYGNLEYIFVDDGSTDNSIALLQKVVSTYPQRKEHIHIIHNDRNHGLAYTRRVSIEAATGEVVICVDSDDYVEPDMAEQLLQACDTPDCDIVAAGYIDEKLSGEKSVIMPLPLQQQDLLWEALEDNISRLWSKLIRRSLFDLPEVNFAPEKMDYLEDRIVLLYLAGAARRINTIHMPLYHYAENNTSVSSGKGDKHFRCLINYWELADSYLAQRGLTDKYLAFTDREKLTDKVHLLHFCYDISVCRQYVNLFADIEARRPALQLTRGKRLTRLLTKHHLWTLLRLYKYYQKCRP